MNALNQDGEGWDGEKSILSCRGSRPIPPHPNSCSDFSYFLADRTWFALALPDRNTDNALGFFRKRPQSLFY
jgi:hypothetical protein